MDMDNVVMLHALLILALRKGIHMLFSNEQKLCQLGMTVRFEWSTYSDLAAAAAAPSHRI